MWPCTVCACVWPPIYITVPLFPTDENTRCTHTSNAHQQLPPKIPNISTTKSARFRRTAQVWTSDINSMTMMLMLMMMLLFLSHFNWKTYTLHTLSLFHTNNLCSWTMNMKYILCVVRCKRRAMVVYLFERSIDSNSQKKMWQVTGETAASALHDTWYSSWRSQLHRIELQIFPLLFVALSLSISFALSLSAFYNLSSMCGVHLFGAYLLRFK